MASEPPFGVAENCGGAFARSKDRTKIPQRDSLGGSYLTVKYTGGFFGTHDSRYYAQASAGSAAFSAAFSQSHLVQATFDFPFSTTRPWHCGHGSLTGLVRTVNLQSG